MAKNKKSTGVNPYRKEQPKRKKSHIVIGIVLTIVLLVAAYFMIWGNSGSNVAPGAPVELPSGFEPEYYAEIDIEGYGVITVGLDEDAAPLSVDNFVALAESGFYDGLTFHRIMEGFMMQGGDPKGNGSGGTEPITGEFSANGIDNPLPHVRGAISMARAQDMNSGSCQFFIVHADSSFLDGQYACFGYVTEGIEVVDAVCGTAAPIDNNGTIPADQQPVINSITIRK